MFLLRDLPRPEAFDRFEAAYGPVDVDAVRLFLTILRAGSDLLNALDGFLEPFGLRHGRWITLVLLMREPDRHARPSVLAEKQGVTRATMSGLLDGLERDGLVGRVPDPEDRRSALVRLTPAGQACLDAVMPAYYRAIQTLLADVGGEDRAAAQKTLDRLLGRVADFAAP